MGVEIQVFIQLHGDIIGRKMGMMELNFVKNFLSYKNLLHDNDTHYFVFVPGFTVAQRLGSLPV